MSSTSLHLLSRCPDTHDPSNQQQEDEVVDDNNQKEEQDPKEDKAVKESESLIVENTVSLLAQGRNRISEVYHWILIKCEYISCRDIVNHSIISGVIGGLIFALFAPFFMPVITDFQANSGMVSGPEIQFEAYPGSGQDEVENVSFWFGNTENRIAQDVTIDIWYRGCPIDRDISHGPFSACLA